MLVEKILYAVVMISCPEIVLRMERNIILFQLTAGNNFLILTFQVKVISIPSFYIKIFYLKL